VSERASMALRAVHSHPGCSAWALWVILETPSGFSDGEWKALLAEELPRLHAAGRVQATRFIDRLTYWPAGYDVPELAGEVVSA